MYLYEFCEIFKNTHFEGHLQRNFARNNLGLKRKLKQHFVIPAKYVINRGHSGNEEEVFLQKSKSAFSRQLVSQKT